jgi:peptidoglycan/xylan/chitin deacetylase (PgdA/CDA1 family)
MMKKLWPLVWMLVLGVGCTLQAPSAPTQEAGTPFGVVPSPLPTATPTIYIPSDTPTITSTITQTATITLTPSITPTPTNTLVYFEAGEAVVPILLYYHVASNPSGSRFYVSPDDFREQMQYLHDQDYTAITITDLILVLYNGGELPAKPVLITFDGGNDNIHTNAFPIMQELGFVGVVYVVANRLQSEGFLNPGELSEMIDAGWQIGSQGFTHQDLTQAHGQVRLELLQSRLDLESQLGVRVTTFAYPFGQMDAFVANKVEEYGYYSAVGLGESATHTWGTLYYLKRFEILGDVILDDFIQQLP